VKLECEEELQRLIAEAIKCQCGTIENYKAGQFPEQDNALASLAADSKSFKIVQVHDDGDLTIEADGKKYAVMTDGSIFVEVGV
jgi:hypothetical protein